MCRRARCCLRFFCPSGRVRCAPTTRAPGVDCFARATRARAGSWPTRRGSSAGQSRWRSVRSTPITCCWGRIAGSCAPEMEGAIGGAREPLCSSGLYSRWPSTRMGSGRSCRRAQERGAVAGRVYLAGRSGLLRSDNWGATWSSYAGGLPEGPVTAFLVVGGSPEIVYRIVGGRIWVRTDGAGVWVNRTVGAAVINVDALVVDQALPTRIWAAGADQLFRSEDQGVRWRAVGRPLPERNTMVRGIAAAGGTIVLTTDRGLYRSADSGERWALLADNLPAHLEAGPLVRDPVDPDTLYAGFALTPYAEIWRRAAEGGNSLRRLSLSSLAGSAAFLTLVALSAVVALRWLRHYYHVPSGPRRHGRGGRAAR